MRTSGILLAAAAILFGQSFDVASVKPNHGGSGANRDPGQYTLIGTSLRNLIVQAYGLERYEYAGPVWMETELYDVAAKMPPGTTAALRNQMLQNLLAERFHLRFHREPREMKVYDLSVARGAPKLQPATADETAPVDTPRPRIVWDADHTPVIPAGLRPWTTSTGMGLLTNQLSMARFAELLSGELEAPVFDRTGLTADYSFALRYVSPRAAMAHPSGSKTGTPASLDGPSIFEALPHQLGLKLNARKAAVEVLVVDSADKAPVEN